jgi:hypothetical protein
MADITISLVDDLVSELAQVARNERTTEADLVRRAEAPSQASGDGNASKEDIVLLLQLLLKALREHARQAANTELRQMSATHARARSCSSPDSSGSASSASTPRRTTPDLRQGGTLPPNREALPSASRRLPRHSMSCRRSSSARLRQHIGWGERIRTSNPALSPGAVISPTRPVVLDQILCCPRALKQRRPRGALVLYEATGTGTLLGTQGNSIRDRAQSYGYVWSRNA